ncbi:MAG: replication factor C large subunit [Candidatus Heimdallarchaeota archaeon]|nr:replication factor C large subunit [Candidatus Heimdallarchaeota archaeon]
MKDKMISWTDKYRPTNLDQVVGNEKAVAKLRKWFDSWSLDAKRKAALLHGPAGTGKTSSVYALARERGYEVVEMNASDKRNKASIQNIAAPSSKEGSLISGTRAKRILLIDEVDGITGRYDRGGVTTLVKVIKDSSVPIVCTANEAYDKKLKALRKHSQVIAYYPVPPIAVLKVLKKISRDQELPIAKEELQFLAKEARGDLRSAINDLQALATQLKHGKATFELLRPRRDQNKEIQQALEDLFHAKSFQEAKRSLDGLDMKYDTLLLWVFENAYKHTSNQKLAEVYETLALADRYLGRIFRRQSWRLLKYFYDLVTAGVYAGIDKPSINIKRYTYPQKIAMYARTRFSRYRTDAIVSSIAEKTHESEQSAREIYLPVVEDLLNGPIEPAAKLAYWLELEDSQIKSLVKDKQARKKIARVMKAIDEYEKQDITSMPELQHSSFDLPQEDWEQTIENYEKKKERLNKEKENKKDSEEVSPEEKETDQKQKQTSLDTFFA